MSNVLKSCVVVLILFALVFVVTSEFRHLDVDAQSLTPPPVFPPHPRDVRTIAGTVATTQGQDTVTIYTVPSGQILVVLDFIVDRASAANMGWDLVEFDGTNTILKSPWQLHDGEYIAGGNNQPGYHQFHSALGMIFGPDSEIQFSESNGDITGIVYQLTGYLVRE